MSYSVLIYANCQGEELQRTGHYLPSMSGRLNFKWIPLHLVTETDWQEKYGRDFMSDVVMVWEQVEAGELSVNRERLYNGLKKRTPVVKFPPLSAGFMWPFSGNDPRVAVDPARYPWPDSIAATLAAERLSDDELFERYMAITTERMPDLDRRLRLDATRWRASDQIADIKLADWVEANFRTTNLFHTVGHITAPAVAHLMKQLLGRSKVLTPALARAAVGEVDGLLKYHSGQDFESVPIHPLVAERLGLAWYKLDRTYRWHAHEWTFREYIMHYIKWQDYIV